MRALLPVTVDVAEDAGFSLQTITNTGLKADGVEVRLVSWEGWTDGADVRANPIDIPGGDGAYDDDPLFAARTIILKGVAVADSPAALLSIQKQFVRLLAGVSRRGTVTVSMGDDPALTSRVRLGGKSMFTLISPTYAEWSLSLYAALPARISAAVSSAQTGPYAAPAGMAFSWVFPWSFGATGQSGQVVCVNNGILPAGVRLLIVGACVNPRVVVQETGERLAFVTTVPQSLDIDTGARSVTRDGVAAWGRTKTSDSNYFLLRPESVSTLLFLVDSGTPTLYASWADTTT